MRVTRVRADAADLGIDADVTFTARTVALEEPRQTITAGTKTVMDSTRLTQWGTWSGRIAAGGAEIPIDRVYGTKDRSWGVRPVGEPTPAAPENTLPQIFFLWAPINWDDCCTHFLCFERGNGDRWVGSQAVLDVDRRRRPDVGRRRDGAASSTSPARSPRCGGRRACAGRRARRCACCATTAREERIELEPLLTFRMRGLGYTHPEWGHGHWHGELAVGSEEHKVEELDNVEPWNIHIQQVMRARWGDQVGLGVLEQLAFGEHDPSGLTGILDGYSAGVSVRTSDRADDVGAVDRDDDGRRDRVTTNESWIRPLLDLARREALLGPRRVRRVEVVDHEVERRVAGRDGRRRNEHEVRAAAQLHDRDLRVAFDLAHADRRARTSADAVDVADGQHRVTDPNWRTLVHARQSGTR